MTTDPSSVLPPVDVAPSTGPLRAVRPRVDLVDALRGFALLGIFLVNLGGFSLYYAAPPEMRAAMPTAAIDWYVGFGIFWLGYGKFNTIFSFLFGLGFSLLLLKDGDTPRRPAAWVSLPSRSRDRFTSIGSVYCREIVAARWCSTACPWKRKADTRRRRAAPISCFYSPPDDQFSRTVSSCMQRAFSRSDGSRVSPLFRDAVNVFGNAIDRDVNAFTARIRNAARAR
jgi:hypothetical protein